MSDRTVSVLRTHDEVDIGAATLSTGDEDRDAHGDFVDVERDTTRPVSLQADFGGAEISPIGDERIGCSAATDVNREDFGLSWNMALETGGVP